MEITRLRLLGFKSFVDSTEIRIEGGLTGIVGPNGCGKSNVLEALRWVMGATSAKALRGKAMDDVIFGGTSGRPPRNTAEVALYLDNSDRSAPAAFNDSDVLEIVRRIEREAGSAFFINGKDVRLRDVQLVFADASTGSNSAALVRQGQISELINAKPENRRRLLEEAAGITGLHKRRHEAELRLNAAETNLLRLDDIQQQLEEQLSGLKRQARQASRYRNLSGHIRRAEATALYLRWTAVRDAVESARAAVSAIEAQVGDLTRSAATAATAQSEAAAAVPPLREAEAAAAAAMHRLTVERDTLDKEEQRARAQAASLEALIVQVEQDRARESAMQSDAKDFVARLKAEAAAISEEADRHETELTAGAERLTQLEAALGERENQLAALVEQNAATGAREGSLRQSAQSLAERHAQIKEKLAAIVAERDEISGANTDLARSAGANETVRAALDQVRSAEAAARTAEAARVQAMKAERDAHEPLLEIERQLNALRGEAKALSDVLKVDEQGLWPPVIDALRVAPGYEKALGAGLGDDLNYPTDEAAPAHWNLIAGEPQGASALPHGAEPLSKFVEAPPQLRRRLSQIGLVGRGDGARLQKDLETGQRLVSLDGDLWRWDGFTFSAEARTPAAARLAQRNRLAELDAEIERVQGAYRDAAARYETARDEAARLTAEEETLRQAWHQAQEDLTTARESLSELEKASADAITRIAELNEAERRLEENQREIELQARQAETELLHVDRSRVDQERLDSLRGEVTELRKHVAEARSAHEGLKRDAEGRQRRLDQIAADLAEGERRQDAAEQQLETLARRRDQAQAELAALSEVPAQIERQRGELLTAIAAAETKRRDAADALAAAEQVLSDCDAAAREAQQTLAEAREERARASGVLTGEEERLVDVEARIRDTLDCGPDSLLEKAELDETSDLPTLDAIESKLERLKRERENMGAVNLRADEEANELTARLNEMQTERQDLESAIAKLRRAISELNREGRERLLGAFDKVNENFARLFQVLFDGGVAHLELTEADDPLEAGLEVFARPPGKRLQNLSLLSGGEQALTAISLIFAVFLSNPAPICFLDEVDAPLDDANVERFCNLLDEMKRTMNTKFMIITHHALTMSRMDRLYGVTMTERGISQLVSVDLTQATRMQAAE